MSLATALVAAGSASPFAAADWTITPRLTVRETYTDNIRHAPRGQESSDWVTELDPGVSIDSRGARLQFHADYAFQQRLYANNSHANGHNHQLASSGLLDVWDRKLFLQAGAVMGQQNISPLGVRSESNINLSGNRTEVRQYNVSPYWQSRLGNSAQLHARYSWNRAESTGETRVLNSETNGININVSSPPTPRTFSWSVVYNKQEIESTSGQFAERELESIIASGKLRIFPTLYGLVSIGRDDNTYGSTRGSTGGDIYDVGVEWIPSSRTRVSATVGDRYFGTTYALDAQHRTRLTTWTLTYSEQIVGTPGVFSVPSTQDTAAHLDRLFLSQVPDPIARRQLVEAVILQNGLPATLTSSVDFLTNQVTLSKRLQGGFGLRGVRSTFVLHLFRDERIRESTGATITGTDPFQISNNVIQTGYSAVFSWQFSERTSAQLWSTQTKSKLTDAGREDENNTFRVGVSRLLQPKLRGAVDFRMTERTSNNAGLDVKEHAIVGTLQMTF